MNSAGFVLGPVLGAILGVKGTHFPLLVAGIVSGLALLFAFFFLHESSRDVVLLNELRAKAKKAPKGSSWHWNSSTEERESLKEAIKQKQQDIKKSRKTAAPKLSKTMVICFLFEFCNRWVVNAFDAKFGIFLNDKYTVKQSTYSCVECYYIH